MDFLESPRFPGCPSFGFVSSSMYKVPVVSTAGGFERRNRDWSRPLIVPMTVTVGPRHEADVYEVQQFFHVVGGKATGFRVKDYSDYQSCAPGGIPMATDQPLVASIEVPGSYQLTKRYDVGGAQTQDREIYKPVQGTILIAGMTESVDYTIDYTTGLVDFTGGAAATWGGEFDVPMRFDVDALPVEITNKQVRSVSFDLIELRIRHVTT
jgi:uncharacterized protein (TIGR02217 family)